MKMVDGTSEIATFKAREASLQAENNALQSQLKGLGTRDRGNSHEQVLMNAQLHADSYPN